MVRDRLLRIEDSSLDIDARRRSGLLRRRWMPCFCMRCIYVSVVENISCLKQSISNESYETLTCNGGPENFKLDTGTDTKLLSYTRFMKLGFTNEYLQRKHNIKLQSYSGDVIPIKGICNLVTQKSLILFEKCNC